MTGAEFKQMRVDAGMTQRAMAKALGIYPEHLSRIENGHSPVQKAHILAARWLAAGLDVAE